MILMGIGDEGGNSIDSQIEATRELGWKHVEMRGVEVAGHSKANFHDIPDEAFERLFGFFNQYEWHLDTRPLRNDREINPDVLGYIFEKYINQKQ